MNTEKQLTPKDFESTESYYCYGIESMINGQFAQAKNFTRALNKRGHLKDALAYIRGVFEEKKVQRYEDLVFEAVRGLL